MYCALYVLFISFFYTHRYTNIYICIVIITKCCCSCMQLKDSLVASSHDLRLTLRSFLSLSLSFSWYKYICVCMRQNSFGSVCTRSLLCWIGPKTISTRGDFSSCTALACYNARWRSTTTTTTTTTTIPRVSLISQHIYLLTK